MKKIISLFLSIVMFALMLAPVFNANAVSSSPAIMIEGRAADTVFKDADGNQIYPITLDKDYILNAVAECIPYLATGLATGDLDPWAKKVAEAIEPMYEKFIPDKTGKIVEGTHPPIVSGKDTWLVPWMSGIEYNFKYDWRMDPYDIVDYLQGFIDTIKEKTGCEKVSLIGRCYGGSIISTYLSKYGHDDIDTVVYYCSTIKGCPAASCAFAGEFSLDPKNLQGLLESNDIIDDPVVLEFLRSTLNFINSLSGLDSTAAALEKLVNETLYPALAKRVMPVWYGRLPAYWGMIKPEKYEKAKKLIFGGNEEEYGEFIARIDRYHDIQLGIEDLLAQYREEGMKLAFIAKCNFKIDPPLFKCGNVNSDNTVETSAQSLGATVADIGKTLSDSYIANVDPEYISSDHVIDASTCAFPDVTWFIKDIDHYNFAWNIDEMMNTICKSADEMTVYSSEKYPRFMKYSGGRLIPLEDEPETAGDDSFLKNHVESFIRWIKSVFAIIKLLFSNINNK